MKKLKRFIGRRRLARRLGRCERYSDEYMRVLAESGPSRLLTFDEVRNGVSD